MKLCQTCGQHLAETIVICPSCGDDVGAGRQRIDGYRIVDVIQEGHASILCKALTEEDQSPRLIRIFKEQAGMNEAVAKRLEKRLRELDQVRHDGFVRHYEIRRSADNLWYRVSEWVEGEEWSRLFASGSLKNHQILFDLFHQLATSLSVLHKSGHFTPYLVLNDIFIIRDSNGELKAKIDYKLSRFLSDNPQMPGTMLNDLLQCHPDIVNNKPLDFRSDIWSLGRIFLQLLTSDASGCPSLTAIPSLKIPKSAKTLLKIMLAEDPTIRPHSMEEVIGYLDGIRNQRFQKKENRKKSGKTKPASEIQRLRSRIWRMSFAMVLLVVGVIGGMAYFGVIKPDRGSRLQDYANQYSKSVAFVLVEYALYQDEIPLYRRRTEGTAFLADEEGYLITNRHVAAPWLLDGDLLMLIDQMKRQGVFLTFDYKMYLWFEGTKAYKQLPIMDNNSGLDDIYYLESAFRSDGKPRVEIAGIERSLVRQGYLSRSPLKDDFAILKIDQVPDGLVPLPLHETLEITTIPKLSPVITIGFPLGSRTQASAVNVSVTRGNVRRTFEDMIQVDTSIYKGNSGGPMIDGNGKVIGITTGILFDKTSGIVPIVTPLSDIGMVLPITKTIGFLNELKAGQRKWNGVPDLSIDLKIQTIKELAFQGNWNRAMKQVDTTLRYSLDPQLIVAAGMIHYCNGDHIGAGYFFNQAISIDPERYETRFMLYLIDWWAGDFRTSPHRRHLKELDWRSDAEFFRYLLQILEGQVSEQTALSKWISTGEMGWIHYASALVHYQKRQPKRAGEILKNAAARLGKENWTLYLILSELHKMNQQRLILSRDQTERLAVEKEMAAFNKRLREEQSVRISRLEKIAPLYSQLMQPAVALADKIAVVERMMELDPDNKELLVSMAFFNAMVGDWESTLRYINRFNSRGAWESKTALSIKLLELGTMKHLNVDAQQIKKRFQEIISRINDSWFKEVLATLSGEKAEHHLVERAVTNPGYHLMTHFALGFWAESTNRPEKAMDHYREVLGTYLDGWWEYEFAKIRIRKLRTHLTN